jgi:hypothetical protein
LIQLIFLQLEIVCHRALCARAPAGRNHILKYSVPSQTTINLLITGR